MVHFARIQGGAHTRRGRTLAMLTASFALFAWQGDLHGDADYNRAEADSMHRKVASIVQLGSSAPAAVRAGTTRSARLTPISERELNAYLRFHIREQVPTGVTDPVITMMGEGRVGGRAVVDLDAVNRANRANSWAVRLLTGKLPVTLAGTLQTSNGVGRFALESATISGLPIPKALLQQVVSYYSRTPDNPDGINLDDPFELPVRIQEIRVQPREAIVVQ